MSNLVDHARRELAIIKEDPEYAEGLIRMVQIFADMGHSGGSASIAVAQLTALLQFQNLSPLTDDPEEWHYHGPDMWDGTNGIWQNKRNGEAFSSDEGKTYYLLSERVNPGGAETMRIVKYHTSRDHTKIGGLQEEVDA